MYECEKCTQLLFGDEPCMCREYTVENPDGEEHCLYAMDAESAARAYAKWYNERNDYCLMDETLRIEVRGTGEYAAFNISAAQSIDYHTRELAY